MITVIYPDKDTDLERYSNINSDEIIVYDNTGSINTDFKKENTFGNIRNQSIQEMLQDTKAVTLRKKIFGAQYSEADFICRRCLDCKQAVRFWNYSKDFAPVYNFSQSFGRKVLK